MYEKFRELCEKKGVTAYKISQETGITQSTFSDWKNGRSVPKQDKLKKIADYFGVDVGFFYDDNETRYYVDDETKRIAQEIFDNKELRLLFDAAKDASSDDLKTVHTMLMALKSKEGI
jgi:transcriptional regulator with XRE-family HTH domain